MFFVKHTLFIAFTIPFVIFLKYLQLSYKIYDAPSLIQIFVCASKTFKIFLLHSKKKITSKKRLQTCDLVRKTNMQTLT